MEAFRTNTSMTHLSCRWELMRNVRPQLSRNRREPWSIKAHATFGFQQRRILATIVLCLQRLAEREGFPTMPPELLLLLFSHLRRMDLCNA